MKYEKLLFLIIVILSLLLVASYLGGFKLEGFSSGEINKTITVYTAPNGETAVVKHGKLTITHSDGSTTIYTATKTSNGGNHSGSGVIYYGPNGGTATVIQGSNGGNSISVVGPDGGQAVVFQSSDGNTSTTTDVNMDDTTNTNTNNTNTTYDNYNHYSGTSSPTTYYGPDDSIARIVNDTLVITNKNGTTTIYTLESGTDPNATVTTYIGKDGRKAVVAIDNNGNYAVSVTGSDGSKIMYYENNVYTYNSQGGTTSSTETIPTNSYDSAFNTYSGANISAVSGPNGNVAATTTTNTTDYMNSLPTGVPKSQIPAGQEDLYILKSEVVPPVCPVCPNLVCPEPAFDETKCGPCPPCERISNNDFECKKVPNYSASNSSILPVPVISDFSGFGM